jgi:hypothetical protein
MSETPPASPAGEISEEDREKRLSNVVDVLAWLRDELTAVGAPTRDFWAPPEDDLRALAVQRTDANARALLERIERDLPAVEQRTERLMHRYGL